MNIMDTLITIYECPFTGIIVKKRTTTSEWYLFTSDNRLCLVTKKRSSPSRFVERHIKNQIKRWTDKKSKLFTSYKDAALEAERWETLLEKFP